MPRRVFLPVAVLFVIIVAGWVLTHFAGSHARLQDVKEGNLHVSALANHLVYKLEAVENDAFGRSKSSAVISAALTGSLDDIELARTEMDGARHSFYANAPSCLLFDISGKAIVMCDRAGLADSEGGTLYNADFFLRKARAGECSGYYAVGGPGERNYYATCPVKDGDGRVIGGVVVKDSLEDVEASFKKHPYCFMVDPNGIIFLSSREDMWLSSLWPLEDGVRRKLASSGQFGEGPFKAVLKSEARGGEYANLGGDRFLVTRRSLGRSGWSLVLLNDTSRIRAYRLFSIFTTFVLFGLTAISFGALHFTRESARRISVSERRYRSLVEGSPNCVILFDSEGRCLTINKAGLELTGYKEADIIGKRLDLIWNSGKFGDIHDPVKGVMKGERYAFNTESLQPGGRHIIWSVVLNPVYDLDGRIRRFVGIFMDITEQKHAENELRVYHEHLEDMVKERTVELSDANRRLQVEITERKQAEESLKMLMEAIESLPIGITITDVGGRIIFANAADARMHGFEVEELMNRDARIMAPSEFWNPLPFDQLCGLGVMRRESMNVRKNGEVFPVQLTSLAVKNTDGVPIGVITACEDISERKRGEEELRKHREHLVELVEERTVELKTAVQLLTNEITFRKSAEETMKKNEAKYRKLSQEFHTLLDAIPDSLLLISPDLKVLWANKGAAASLGKEVHALPGHSCYEIWFGRSDPCEDCYALKSFRSGGAESSMIRSTDGRLMDSRAFPIQDENGQVTNVIIVATDITEKTTLQAEALRAGHLASLGELAAGVAHEINNPINGIINYAQMLANRSGLGSIENDISSRIIKEGDRIAGIVRNLLSFARKRGEERLRVTLEKVLLDTITLTEVQLRKECIDLCLSVPKGIPAIIANPQQIQQVFLNLISNARYALNQKYPAAHDDKKLEISGEKVMVDGVSYVRTVFCDRGTGIPEDLLEKVINPFFSTKPSGEGTGLGLSISHGIVKDHGGRLMLESRQGAYTRVVVDLPAEEEHGK
jgi:PAS domain S-box-containing protein